MAKPNHTRGKRAFDPDLAARVLLRAAQVGDAKAAEEFGLAQRTIRRWRALRDESGPKAEQIQAKEAELTRRLDDDLVRAIRETLRKMVQLVSKATDVHELPIVKEAFDSMTSVLTERQALLDTEEHPPLQPYGRQPTERDTEGPPAAGPAGEAPGPASEGAPSGAALN
jgi:hypothetical protein